MGSSAPDTEAHRIASDLARRLLAAMESGDLATCLDCHVDEGAMITSYGPAAFGSSALRETYRFWLAGGGRNKRFKVVEAALTDGFGYCLLEYSSDIPDGAGNVINENGRSLNVMERCEDGRWRFRLTSLNARAPGKRGFLR